MGESDVLGAVESYVNGLVAFGCFWSHEGESETPDPLGNRMKTIVRCN